MYSCYIPLNATHDDFLQVLGKLEDDLKMAKGKVLVAGDFNYKAYEWGSRKIDTKGIALLDMTARLELLILNQRNTFIFRKANTGSVIDIKIASRGIAKNPLGWKVL